MERIESSETPALKAQTPRDYPKKYNTAFNTRRKFEIKINSSICLQELLKTVLMLPESILYVRLTWQQSRRNLEEWYQWMVGLNFISVSSEEREVNTTAVCFVSAAGFHVPPMVIYKLARGCDVFKDGTSPGTVFAFNPESSYINKGLFLKRL